MMRYFLSLLPTPTPPRRRKSQTTRTTTTALLVFIIFLFLCHAVSAHSSSGGGGGDPYHALGLTSDATQDEIRTNYRKLCLKYHPDKNVGKSPKEQQRCTEMFKKIQEANSLIGDPDSRRSYDLLGRRRRATRGSSSPFTDPSFWDDLQQRTSSRSSSGSSSSPYERNPRYNFRDENVDAFYRAFSSAASRGRGNNDPRFFGFSSSSSSFPNDLFRRPGSSGGLFSNFGAGGRSSSPSFKMKYVQKVQIPLQDLYMGKPNMEFQLQETLWKRYCAVFRGGLGYLLLYQSFLFAAPILRLSKWLALAVGAIVFHANVPQHNNSNNTPEKHFLDDNDNAVYTTDILAGYKEGTKITFSNEDTNTDIIFVLEEEPHHVYWREGNELHASVDILASQAKDGCSLQLESLNPNDEDPITIKLRPHQIQESGDTLKVAGKGWPQRKKTKTTTTTSRGDLIIHFRIVRKIKKKSNTATSSSRSRRRKRKGSRKKQSKKKESTTT